MCGNVTKGIVTEGGAKTSGNGNTFEGWLIYFPDQLLVKLFRRLPVNSFFLNTKSTWKALGDSDTFDNCSWQY